MKKDIQYLHKKKERGIPIVMVTAYDYPTALIEDEAGVDSILVGDSVGTNMLGYASEQEVTMADMLHHLGAVSRAVKKAFIIGDMPFGAAENNEQALENARAFMQRGADCVKLEGWAEKVAIIDYLTKNNIPVCAHIGYNPQIHGAKPRTFGKQADQALELIRSANALEQAGSQLIVLEKIPDEIAAIISKELRIPTIGIGSGNKCDGQVLVANDLLGMNAREYKHARRYMDYSKAALQAFTAYKTDVESRTFPSEENTWHINEGEIDKVKDCLKE